MAAVAILDFAHIAITLPRIERMIWLKFSV